MKLRHPELWLVSMAVCAFVLGLCAAGSRAVTAMAMKEYSRERTVFVVDAGHGGIDTGAVSCTGLAESGYNLQISLRLRDLLELMGYRVRTVRTEDTSVHTSGDTIAQQKLSDLKQRAAMADQTENSILLSIHQNHFPDSRYRGPQVFHSAKDESRELALLMQMRLNAALAPDSRRMAKEGEGIYLLEHISCPGVLVECGFLSNPAEEALLRDPGYQQKLCCVLACTAAEFVEGKYPNT